MKKICAITMARNDNFFLERWIDYYSKQIGEENIHILLDGLEQNPPKNVGNVNVSNVQRKPMLAQNGKDRAIRLSELSAKLLEKYDIVICCDADEFLVLDPNAGTSLKEYLSTININTSISGLGIDIGQQKENEKSLVNDKSFLSQRNRGLLSSRYTKPVVVAKKMQWGAGIHRVKGKNFHIDENLFLFHFGLSDYAMLEKKASGELAQNGWSNHFKRQFKIMDNISSSSTKSWDKYTSCARFVQRYFRSLYAWNKPSMWFWKIVVKIPSRFNKII